jgi:hypothetical protein
MKQLLTIVGVVQNAGISKKTNQPYDIRTAHCILKQNSEERGEQLLVGTINLPPNFKNTEPGDYLAEFAFQIGFGQDQGRLVPQIVALAPFGNIKPQPKGEAKAA